MSRPATASTPAHRALLDACDRQRPPCVGDSRFTADEVGPLDEAEMKRMCNGCPALILCRAYARTARPEAGFWAAKARTTSPSPKP